MDTCGGAFEGRRGGGGEGGSGGDVSREGMARSETGDFGSGGGERGGREKGKSKQNVLKPRGTTDAGQQSRDANQQSDAPRAAAGTVSDCMQ